MQWLKTERGDVVNTNHITRIFIDGIDYKENLFAESKPTFFVKAALTTKEVITLYTTNTEKEAKQAFQDIWSKIDSFTQYTKS